MSHHSRKNFNYGLVVDGESFHFMDTEGLETVGTTVSQQMLSMAIWGQQFCPTIKSNKYLFIDNNYQIL